MKGPARHALGWFLTVLGIIGLILPIMPGWVFLIPGLVILSDYFPWAKRLLDWAKKKAGHGDNSDRNDTRTETPRHD